jgi:hypothetical protein
MPSIHLLNYTAAETTGVAQGCNIIMLSCTAVIVETLNDTLTCNYTISNLFGALYCIILSAGAERVYSYGYTVSYSSELLGLATLLSRVTRIHKERDANYVITRVNLGPTAFVM